MRRYRVTDAAVHDSQVVDDILDRDNTAAEVWGDSAYWSAAIVVALKAKGLKSRLHRKGQRAKPLSEREKQGNNRRFGRGWSTCSAPRATTWAARWCAALAWSGRRRGSG